MRRFRRSAFLSFLAVALLAGTRPAPAAATWSIIAVDTRSGVVVIASATCVSAEGLRTRGGLKSIQAIIVPGIGVAAAQAAVDGTRANQTLIYQEMQNGTDPDAILSELIVSFCGVPDVADVMVTEGLSYAHLGQALNMVCQPRQIDTKGRNFTQRTADIVERLRADHGLPLVARQSEHGTWSLFIQSGSPD